MTGLEYGSKININDKKERDKLLDKAFPLYAYTSSGIDNLITGLLTRLVQGKFSSDENAKNIAIAAKNQLNVIGVSAFQIGVEWSGEESAITFFDGIKDQDNKKQNNGTKKCPYCAEEIKTEAIFCRYCHRDL